MTAPPTERTFEVYTRRHLADLGTRLPISATELDAMRVVAAVYPFRANSYVVEDVIDWTAVPDDPIFRLVFPQREMLRDDEFDRMAALVLGGAEARKVEHEARLIRAAHNPHPSGQVTLNAPTRDDEVVDGLQHKYAETVLYFPAAGQRCHAYCTYCFRWAQFVDGGVDRFAQREPDRVVEYLRLHPEVRDVIITGGDPMVMDAAELERCIRPLITSGLDHVRTIRIGTKSPVYWPFRFLTDPDTDDVLRLFESVVDSGRKLSVMLHQSHPRELDMEPARRALERIRSTGAVVYTQAPILRSINDSAAVWAEMLAQQLAQGCVPYYAFVERDTGPNHHFEIPLVRAHEIVRDALASLPGLARTLRGPVMSATPGKVAVDGVVDIGGAPHFALHYVQARDASRVGRPFFAKYDADATWFTQLELLDPSFGS